jgi:hypothetical protein
MQVEVPTLAFVPGPGPARIEWNDADGEARAVAGRGCLMDMQRLGIPGVTDRQVVRIARKYGPLRVGRSGRPGAAGRPGGLGAADRAWEDDVDREHWRRSITGEADWADDEGEDERTLDAIFLAGDSAAWEPLAAWRCYGRVLRTLLDIGAELWHGRTVQWEAFADAWSPAGPLLRPLVPPPMLDARGDKVQVDGESVPAPQPARPEARFDPADPAAWEPSDYVRAWWRTWEQAIDEDGRAALNPRQALTWCLAGLARAAGLGAQLAWADAPLRGGQSIPDVPSFVLAPSRDAVYPIDQPWRRSLPTWGVWEVCVSELYGAITAPRDWLGCAECGKFFPLEEGKRRPRRRPQGVDPWYCGDDCRRTAENRRQVRSYERRRAATD